MYMSCQGIYTPITICRSLSSRSSSLRVVRFLLKSMTISSVFSTWGSIHHQMGLEGKWPRTSLRPVGSDFIRTGIMQEVFESNEPPSKLRLRLKRSWKMVASCCGSHQVGLWGVVDQKRKGGQRWRDRKRKRCRWGAGGRWAELDEVPYFNDHKAHGLCSRCWHTVRRTWLRTAWAWEH